MKKKSSYKDIIENYIDSAVDPFSIDTALNDVESKLDKRYRYSIEKIADHFYKSDLLFFDMDEDGDDIFIPRQSFFKGAKFRIVPTSLEIEKGILYPGHRFQPFCAKNVFPGDTILKYKNKKVATRSIESKIGDVYIYHSLLGIGEFANYAITDHQENDSVFYNENEDDCLKLTVFDFSDIYNKTKFKQGDAFIFTVKNWLKGTYDISYSSIVNRETEFQVTREWCESFQSALQEVLEDLGPTASINEQLAWTFFNGGKHLLTTPAIHIGGFLSWSSEIAIKDAGLNSVLWWHDQDPNEDLYFGDLQDKVCLTGCTDSLDSILEDINVSLCQIEIEAYMRDEIYQGRNKYKAVIDRCFKSRTIEFYDDEQEKAFYQFFKKLWDLTKKSYNPFQDQKIGTLRSSILLIVDKQLKWLRTMDKKQIIPEELPSEQMIGFAETSGLLTQLLSALAMDDDSDDTDHLDQLSKTISEVDDSVDIMIEEMNQLL